MNFIVRNIPNCITSLNLLGGVGACICAAMMAVTGDTYPLGLAYCFIAFSAVADFLDGLCARLLGAYSDLGKQLDSLSDLVSFGVAPGLLLFFTLMNAGVPVWICWMSLLVPLCGAWRLGRFNTESAGETYFKGIPIPANAIFWIGYTWRVATEGVKAWQAVVVIIVISWLMVSSLRMLSLKFHKFAFSELWPVIALLAGCAVLCIVFGIEGLMFSICYYIILSVLLTGSKFLK